MRRRLRRRRSGLPKLRNWLALALLFGALTFVGALFEEEGETGRLAGAAQVVDGDSLTIGGRRIRLVGIDAPEHDQTCRRRGAGYPCGEMATHALRELAGNGDIVCDSARSDRYGRALAECMAGDVALNREMVLSGWAVADGAYRDAEDEARRAGRGIWQGEFDEPRQWRRVHGDLVEDMPNEGLRAWLRRALARFGF